MAQGLGRVSRSIKQPKFMFTAACNPQALGFDSSGAGRQLLGIQERPGVAPPQPRPNFPRRQTAPAIDLFYLASGISNSKETSQSRLWRVSFASKQKWKASVCRNTKSTAGMKRRRGTPSRVLGFRECKQAGNYHRCNKFPQRSEATRPLTSSKPRGCCLSTSNS